MSRPFPPTSPADDGFDAGRRYGLATAALALSVVSFLNLLGMEKSMLALVLAVIAMRGAEPIGILMRRSRVAIGIAVLHVLTISVVLVIFHEKFAELLTLLHELS